METNYWGGFRQGTSSEIDPERRQRDLDSPSIKKMKGITTSFCYGTEGDHPLSSAEAKKITLPSSTYSILTRYPQDEGNRLGEPLEQRGAEEKTIAPHFSVSPSPSPRFKEANHKIFSESSRLAESVATLFKDSTKSIVDKHIELWDRVGKLTSHFLSNSGKLIVEINNATDIDRSPYLLFAVLVFDKRREELMATLVVNGAGSLQRDWTLDLSYQGNEKDQRFPLMHYLYRLLSFSYLSKRNDEDIDILSSIHRLFDSESADSMDKDDGDLIDVGLSIQFFSNLCLRDPLGFLGYRGEYIEGWKRVNQPNERNENHSLVEDYISWLATKKSEGSSLQASEKQIYRFIDDAMYSKDSIEIESEIFFRDGVNAFRERRYQQAVVLFNKSLNLRWNPDTLIYLEEASWMDAGMKLAWMESPSRLEMTKANELFDRVIKSCCDNEDALIHKAWIVFKQRNRELSLYYLRRVLELNGEYWINGKMLEGVILYQGGELESALAAFHEVADQKSAGMSSRLRDEAEKYIDRITKAVTNSHSNG